MNKVLLTEDNIKYILSDIQPIKGLNENVASKICEQIRQKLIDKLKNIKIYPSKLEDLKKKLTIQYYSSQVTPGDSVGIATAQSIGERQTQLALNSFHSTGITTATVVTGVPRFNELVNTTKNPKNVITKIYPKIKCNSIQEIRSYTGQIKHVLFKHLVLEYNLNIRSNHKLSAWYNIFLKIYPDKASLIKSCTHYIRIHFDLRQLYISRINIKDIVIVLESYFENIICCWSTNNLGIIDIWFNECNLKLDENKVIKKYITLENRAEIYMDEILIPNLQSLTIKGIEGIEQVNYNQYQGEWFIEAMGYNLQTIFSLPFIDMTRTSSNHMWEIYNILGIEATREFLIQEFQSVISVDSYINIRHIQLLVDVMLYTGSISSISRYGVHKNQSGALTKCSFEESLDQFLKAGIYGEDEDINGVSGAIICGKISNIGSGLCDLLYAP